MELRDFGRTGMRVTALGFGGAEIGFGNADLATVERLLNGALDAGLNVIDTAECYNASEELIGKAVGHRRDSFYLFTKCGHAAGLDLPDWDPRMLEQSIDRSLQRLRTDRLDLIQLHTCSEEQLRQGDVIAVLQKARDAGKTRFIGYSGDQDAARYAVDCGAFDSLQTSLSIAEQEPIELSVPYAAERGMGVIAKRPVANVAWRTPDAPPDNYSAPYWNRLKELDYPFLHGSLPEAVATALRFTLSVPGLSTAIVGTMKPERWQENAAYANQGPLSPQEYQAIRGRWAQAARPDWRGQG